MRVTTLFGSVGFACAMATAANAQWLDDFDSYALGPLAAQSAWEEWYSSTGVDADVDNTYSFTTSNSVLIVQNNDVVYDFANLSSGRPASGVWSASVKTYVPSGTTGIGWYILLNDYQPTPHWSVQTQLDATNGKVVDGTSKTRLKYDEWVSLVVAIDLDNDRYDSWYGDKPLVVNRKWTDVGGQTAIAVNDLYGDAGGLSGIWFDNDRLEKTAGGPLVVTTSPNPITSGQTLTFFSESPLLTAGDVGLLFLWSINGSFFLLPLVNISYDINGEWNFGVTIPPGLSGLELGFKAFALPAGGKILMSNEDVVLFL
jgi:hypothetical protein